MVPLAAVLVPLSLFPARVTRLALAVPSSEVRLCCVDVNCYKCSRIVSPPDIDNQGGDQQEVYFYMNSNHEQSIVTFSCVSFQY